MVTRHLPSTDANFNESFSIAMWCANVRCWRDYGGNDRYKLDGIPRTQTSRLLLS